MCVCTDLQAWVDGEAPCRRVHAGDVLNIVDLLQKHLGPVIPAHTHTHTHDSIYISTRLYSTNTQKTHTHKDTTTSLFNNLYTQAYTGP